MLLPELPRRQVPLTSSGEFEPIDLGGHFGLGFGSGQHSPSR
jgi:hypothetical protein